MLTLTKKEIGNWILLDYLAQRQQFQDKINFLERKHNADLQSFESQVNHASAENFEAWDDLIEWKAYTQFLSEIDSKIADIRNGDFQMAG